MPISKTPHSAVVLIPPQELWEPIQSIRRTHDSHVLRWMPHITLLFPFLPADQFAEAEAKIDSACGRVAPFRIKLARFEYFAGPKTAWIEPEPAESVRALQAALQREFPAFDEVSRFPGGFRPHLSVGQGRHDLITRLQAAWTPLEFEVSAVSLIRRNGAEDPFRVHRAFPLTGQ
jgi:2'-5' RNA ligase